MARFGDRWGGGFSDWICKQSDKISGEIAVGQKNYNVTANVGFSPTLAVTTL